jgi:hypothetical protein
MGGPDDLTELAKVFLVVSYFGAVAGASLLAIAVVALGSLVLRIIRREK